MEQATEKAKEALPNKASIYFVTGEVSALSSTGEVTATATQYRVVRARSSEYAMIKFQNHFHEMGGYRVNWCTASKEL